MVFIVIPVFNRWKFTKDCLNSLFLQSYNSFQIVIVDDGSTDETFEGLKNYPEVRRIEGDGSFFWTRSINEGIDYVLKKMKPLDSDFILMLNNDVILPSTYLQNAMSLYDSINSKFILGSVNLNYFKQCKVIFCGTSRNRITCKTFPLSKLFRHFGEIPDYPLYSSGLPGRGTFYPIKAITNLGFLDQINLPHYGSDQEYSVRAMKNGYDLLLSKDVHLFSYPDENGISSIFKGENKLGIMLDLWRSIKSPYNLKMQFRMNYYSYGLYSALISTARTFLSSLIFFHKNDSSAN